MKGKLMFMKRDEEVNVFDVINHKGEELGEIYYMDSWKQFVFESYDGSYYSYDCMREIADYLVRLTESRGY